MGPAAEVAVLAAWRRLAHPARAQPTVALVRQVAVAAAVLVGQTGRE